MEAGRRAAQERRTRQGDLISHEIPETIQNAPQIRGLSSCGAALPALGFKSLVNPLLELGSIVTTVSFPCICLWIFRIRALICGFPMVSLFS